ncbi:putative Retrovirus-related Pol polyprotein from transposon 17.6 [Hypsibius exemplaris]|uniref:RNA-directed DNA polymerase n=1 Tax=Hypsibius exemplaris TaxID=2072580 RepID=A0A9X6RK47_HYPEX|nr:putative Retrovirus-related Pol polyprotein from transposon 17.6 [Hypsibius exemplaris]
MQRRKDGAESLSFSNSFSTKGPRIQRLVGRLQKTERGPGGAKYPIPLISDVLDQLRGSNYFTTLGFDMRISTITSGRKFQKHLVPHNNKRNVPTKNFTIRHELQWSNFSTNDDSNFGELLGKHLSAIYIDDMSLGTVTFPEHLHSLELVFMRLREANLTLQINKCRFAMPSIKLLGFILSQKGISQDAEKTRAIKEYPTPTTATAVRAFYGLASFYRMYIPKFAEISKPLTLLYAGKEIKKNSKITWGPNQQKAFETLKERLTTFPCLAYFQDELETFVHCDAKHVACGAVLAQKHGKYLRPVAFASRAWVGPEKNLSTVKKEALCIVWISVKWRSYLVYREVTIVTDQNQFRFKIIHKSGVLNWDADALSHYAVGENPSDAENVMNAESVMTLAEIDMRVEQLSDKFCGDLISFLEGNTQNPSDRLKRLSTGFHVDDGILYYRVKEEGWNRELLVLPQSQWLEVLRQHP